MHRARLGLTLAASAAVIATLIAAPAEAQDRKSIRWATSSVDSYGYRVASSMTKILEEALGKDYTVTVNPYPSTTGAMKAAMDGNGEIGYTADVGMTQLYEGSGGFKDYDPGKGKLVHTWYAYPMESFMAVPKSKAGDYKCLKDIAGKPTFFTTAGFMNWLNFQRIYKALGYDFKHVQIDAKTNADALNSGTIAGSVAYTTAGRSLATYWKETDIRTDVAIINPCPDEIAKLKAAGLAIADVDPKIAFTKDVGVKEIKGVPILFGYNVRADMPEDVVYKMLNAFFKNRADLAKADPGFTPMAKDFVGMQVNGISANPQIPVHPGLAKFLKEQKAWNDKWKIAS
ncbi:MAG TPA: TAXI family TRAP transporter solute-binding subunit [Xanthobacteraceae bacterium]|nr:TAXI family TRAP transporter solute-binding subunit [Xanthobacteraceae bacterium]